MNNTSLPSGKNDNRDLLALYVDANELTIDGELQDTTVTTITARGYGLTISHYLRLTGKIDLEGESQLIQETDSDLLVDATGELEKRPTRYSR